jgi:hypothetical protein
MGEETPGRQASPSSPAAEPQGGGDLETLLRRRVPLRTRLVQGAGVLLVVAVVLVCWYGKIHRRRVAHHP